jgi:hypothetical protein
VYPDITPEYAKKLIALDQNKVLGALSYFTPVDEEAVNFMKTVERNPGGHNEKAPENPEGGGDKTPKPLTRAELIAEAKSLGIKGADRMTVEELKEVIAAQKAGPTGTETAPPPDTPPEAAEGAEPLV